MGAWLGDYKAWEVLQLILYLSVLLELLPCPFLFSSLSFHHLFLALFRHPGLSIFVIWNTRVLYERRLGLGGALCA